MDSSQISLSSSRLRNNGSLKNSPNQMFPSLNVKKRSSNGVGGFENTEPSSPKVSCIGQVRVKSKIKQARKNRTATRSKSCRRNLSFRKLDGAGAKGGDFEIPNYQFQQQEGFSDRNQRWVHFPATICRAFGAEFNCFLPCKSFSCMAANESEKEDKMSRSDVVAQWLVAVQDGSGEGDIEDDVITSHRRHVFEELDIENFVQENKNNNCIIPPKNALLLMRFRSDPVKMETLANKFWDCPQDGDFDGENDGDKGEEKRDFFSAARNSLSEENEHMKVEVFTHRKEECTIEEQESELISDSICNGINESVALVGEGKDNDEAVHEDQVKEEIESSGYALNGDVMVDQHKLGNQENENGFDEVLVLRENESGGEESIEPIFVEKEELGIGFDDGGKIDFARCSSSSSAFIEAENESKLFGEEHKLEKEQLLEVNGVEAVAIEKESLDKVPESLEETRERSEPELDQKMRETTQNVVPGCLMLMMREPELSVEVSKETWICESSDFIRCLPPKSKNVENQDPKKRSIVDSKPNNNLQLQPPRSSCSFPAAPPSKTVPNCGSESTMAGSSAYELPRCKSEPRWSAAKLGPEACFWKNRKLEPHCPATTLGF